VIKRRQTGPVSVYALNSYLEKNPKKRGQEILFAIDNCQPYQLNEYAIAAKIGIIADTY